MLCLANFNMSLIGPRDTYKVLVQQGIEPNPGPVSRDQFNKSIKRDIENRIIEQNGSEVAEGAAPVYVCAKGAAPKQGR